MPDLIPLCVPKISGNEWQYIKECLDTGWVSSVGSYVDKFERSVADYVSVKHAIATVNGTAALHVALQVAGVQPNDEVLVSTLTFIASVNSIRYVGAYPVFMDAEPKYWQMDSQKVTDFIERECIWVAGELRNKTSGRHVSALLPVHILGHPVDLDPLIDLAKKYNLKIIEDATESLGAEYKEKKVGSLGDIACFSFNGNKLITTGGGGMVVTDNSSWAERLRYLTTQAKDDPIEYVHNNIGYNYRLTNIQAAMGCAQMEKLDNYITSKRNIADYYTKSLASLSGISPMPQAQWAKNVYWMYTILIEKALYGKDSRALLQELATKNIQTRPLWQPLHLSNAHQDCQSYHCDVAEKLNEKALSLPCSVGLLKDEQERVIASILKNSE